MTTLKEEQPYAAVVDNEFVPLTCSRCFAWNSEHSDEPKRVKLSRCAGCHVLYYCSSKCQKADWKDHKPECKLLRSTNFLPSMDARLVMRMMEKSKRQPNFKVFNGRTYESLVHHSAERRQNVTCMAEARAIYSEIGRFMGNKAPNFETVFLALSKKAMNAFPLHDGHWNYDPRGIALYLGLSVLEHHCRPDAFVVNHGSKMLLRTTKEGLVYNEKLTISYHDGFVFMDTEMRRTKLLATHLFYCRCDECEDIEANKKMFSGRSVCCPNSWFYIPDRICNSCHQEVPLQLAADADDAMDRIGDAVLAFTKKGCDISAHLPKWMKLFDYCKKLLWDENAFLFTIMNIIYGTAQLTDKMISCKYVDLCLPQARKHPHCVTSAVLFTHRQQYYEVTKKTPQEIKEAVNEALESVQVVFGPEHDLTQTLLEKKMLYDLENLKTR